MDALRSGLWLYWVTERAVVAVPRPALRLLDDSLHCADGPAVWWPDGARYFFWRGVQVPEAVVTRPETLTAALILAERNAEVRRVMVERVGYERFLLESGARPMHQDETGTLYRIEMPDDEPLVLVHVVNATPEPDGSRRRFFLRVPPDMVLAKQAVAWTFALAEAEYRPVEES